MNELIEECRKLNQMIMDSKEYKNYVFARNTINSNEDLSNQINEFLNRYNDVMRYTDGNPYDELLGLYNENDELIHNSSVNEFLRAKSSFSKLVKRLIDEISDGLDIE